MMRQQRNEEIEEKRRDRMGKNILKKIIEKKNNRVRKKLRDEKERRDCK